MAGAKKKGPMRAMRKGGMAKKGMRGGGMAGKKVMGMRKGAVKLKRKAQ